MSKLEIEITTLSPLHLGSVRADVMVDAEVVRDEFGMPYFPAKRFKGILYESALEVAEMAELSKSGFLTRTEVETLFQHNTTSDVQLIFSDLFLPEIEKMREDWKYLQKKFAEFIKDYKKYMSNLRDKINEANETVNVKDKQNIKNKTKGFDLDKMTQYFDSDMKPKNLFKEEPYFKYFVKIKGFIIPFEFMKLLGNLIEKKFENKGYDVEGDKFDLILKISREKDGKLECKMEITLFKFDDNEYFIEFRRKESSLKEFYEYFLEIKTIIKTILE